MRIFARGFAILIFALTGAVHAATEWNAQDYDLYAGDFNGDGKTDILYIAKDPSMPSGIAVSDGTGPNIAWQSWPSNFLGINWSGNGYSVIVADFNGDGKADIFLQSNIPGNSYLLLTSSSGYLVGISQTIAESTMGLLWSADQHRIVAGDFNGDHKADLFLQATSTLGTDAVVFADANGMFTSASPAQTWSDGYLGFKWSTKNANVFAGDFNHDGRADLLIQALPNWVQIDYTPSFPVPNYPPNMNGVVLAQTGGTPFVATGVQAWSRLSNGVDWSPLTNNVVIGVEGTGQSIVILQAKSSSGTSYELIGNTSGAIFPTSATGLSSNVTLSAGSYHLITANFGGGAGVGVYFQALTSGGTNYVSDAVASSMSASVQNPTGVTGTVEATSAGRTASQFTIAPTGAASYNIPLWIPPGARDIEPHLALHYTSGGPDGVMGPGWALAGISSIVRCGKTWASSGGAPAGVTLTTGDDLCIDGNRLRKISGTQGMGGSQYFTELADFSLINANGSSSSPLTSFTVSGKDGRYYEYGNTSVSAYSAYTATGSSAPYAWALDKVYDRQGNSMVFSYVSGSTTVTLQKIQYTATPGSGGSFNYEVDFNYAARSGGTILSKSVAGGTVKQANELVSIVVKNSGTIVRQYNLAYDTSPTTTRPLLMAVQECGGSSGTDCIRPTTISYQQGAAGWSTSPTSTGLTGQYGFYPVDLNGDGVPDVVYGKVSGSSIHWYARIATTTGYGSEIDTGAQTTGSAGLIFASFSGRQSTQFLAAVGAVGSQTWYVYSYANSAFTSASTSVPVTNEGLAVDWDGDGLPDLISTAGNNVLVRRNITPAGGAVAFASTATVVWAAGAYPPNYPYTFQTADFNGDGRADLVVVTPLGTKGGYNLNFVMSNGFGTTASATSLNGNTFGGSLNIGDWNGDGCTDLISTTTIFISNCNGSFTQLTTSAPTGSDFSLAVDWNDDGQTDLIYADSGNWYLQRSTGSGIAAPVSLGIAAPSSQNFFVLDRNSDGQLDLGYVDSSNGYAVGYYLHNGANAPPDLASSITDGFGIYFSPTYVPTSQSTIYAKGSAATFPDEDFQGPMYVVNQFTASDGTGSSYQTSFTYAGARLNLQGRGFEGFATTTSIDSRNGLVHSTAYAQAFPFIGSITEDDIFQSDGKTPISKISNAPYGTLLLNSSPLTGYTTGSAACSSSCFPYIGTTTVSRYEVGGTKNGALVSTTSTSYTYDAFGSLTLTNSTVTDQDSLAPASPFYGKSWNTQIANAITNYTSTWCLGRPSTTTSQKTAYGQSSLTRTVTHAIDSTNCRATNEIVEPNTSVQVATTFGFDGCGNTNSVSVVGLDETGAAMPARATTYNYSYATTRCQFPEQITNPLGQSAYVTYAYNWGLKQSSTDPNGLVTSWTYDDFARPTKEVRPDLTATSWTYLDCVSPSCWGTSDLRFQTTQTLYDSAGNAVRVHQTFADGMDRIRFEEGNRALGVWDTAVTYYDSLGRKTETLLPYSSSSNGYHVYTYDLANRPLTDTLYTASSAQYRQLQMGYLGQTATVKDFKGNLTTKVADVVGKLRSVTDPAEGIHGAAAGTTTYTYDSFDNLVKIVDAIGATSTYTYNIRGFKTGSSDSDAGTWVFQPDSLNELKIQTDANGAVTKFAYDSLGRMLSRLEPESPTATQWVYGTSASSYNIGQLASVSKPDGYAESYQYDSAARLKTKIVTEDSTNYQFDYAYNVQGTLNTLTYPTSTSGTRFALHYLYDVSGYLNSVQDATAGTAFWTLTGASDASLPTMEVLGNAVSVATGYTPWTNEMTSRTEGSGGSTTNLQNLSYSWDLNSNLQQRVDNRQGLTETFTLDALNRLSGVTLNSANTLSVQYDQAGDITYKSDVGNYTYGSSSHRHAVTAAGSWSIGYDSNGNMNSRAGGAITSYSYNVPNQINYNGSSSQFNYDSSHQRWKQVANYAGTTETIHYIGGLFQVVTRGTSPTEYRHQIPAGSSTAVYTRRSDGSTGTYYATSDHLGSSDLVLDSAANVLVRESFTPFGARRGSNWQGIPTTGDYTNIQTTTRQGFTGHEMLDAVGLVHMNGRVYDPTLGRFMSADTVIQSLGITQSVNPYSYAWNDPLTFTDPSGHSLIGDIIGLLVGIFVAWALPEFFSTYFASLSVPTLTVAGFVGGFVGAYISTGSLSAALTAGLIAGITAAAFAEIGSYVSTLQQAGSEWAKPFSVLAHAAVGCGSAVASGGNCGRGALAAGISEAATQARWIGPPGKSLASWGTLKGAAEAGLVGGVAARIVGGKFDDGFTVSAAGYIFNSASHAAQSQLSAQSGVPPAIFMSDDALNPGFFVPGTYSPDPGAVQSVLGPESLPLLMGLSPAFAAEGAAETTTLFRAVSEAEYADISATGTLRAGPNSFETGKWFAELGVDATQWGNAMEGAGNFRVIQAEFPTATSSQFFRLNSLDGIGPARFGTFDQLGSPTISLWPGP